MTRFDRYLVLYISLSSETAFTGRYKRVIFYTLSFLNNFNLYFVVIGFYMHKDYKLFPKIGKYCEVCGKVHFYKKELPDDFEIRIIGKKSSKRQKKKNFDNCMEYAIGFPGMSSFVRCRNWGCVVCRLLNAKHWYNKLAIENYDYKTCSVLCLTTDKFPTEKEFSQSFNRYWKNIQYYCQKKGFDNPSYFNVYEYTKAGRLHLHGILRNVPKFDIDWLRNKWELGNIVWINQMKKIRNVANDLFKYLVKSDEQIIRDRKYGLSKKIRYSYNFFESEDLKTTISNYQNECNHEWKVFPSYFVKRKKVKGRL